MSCFMTQTIYFESHSIVNDENENLKKKNSISLVTKLEQSVSTSFRRILSNFTLLVHIKQTSLGFVSNANDAPTPNLKHYFSFENN